MPAGGIDHSVAPTENALGHYHPTGAFVPDIALPPDLGDRLLRLVRQDRGDLVPEPWPPFIPPSWRPWSNPVQEVRRRLSEAAAATARITAEAALRGARMAALDVLVGGPCLTAARLFAGTGHADAALLLREFVQATGPQTRIFAPGSAFSLGFARSETTAESVTRALAKWKARPGGVQANGGIITQLSCTFLPVHPTIRIMPMPGPSAEIYGTPEAHVIGSFGYIGKLVEGMAEWRAVNELSLKSYFADNWTKRVNISLVDNNRWPSRYGNTKQIIAWQTTLEGKVIG